MNYITEKIFNQAVPHVLKAVKIFRDRCRL